MVHVRYGRQKSCQIVVSKLSLENASLFLGLFRLEALKSAFSLKKLVVVKRWIYNNAIFDESLGVSRHHFLDM